MGEQALELSLKVIDEKARVGAHLRLTPELVIRTARILPAKQDGGMLEENGRDRDQIGELVIF